MFLSLILIIIGFIFLVKGADILVDGASNIAKKFNIPEIVIGLTIVSLGTTMPELFVSTTSALEGHTDMAIGNVIGSIAANLLLILGLTTVLNPIDLKKETRFIEIPISMFIFIVFMYMCNTGKVITPKEGRALIIMLIAFLIYTVIMAIKGKEFEEGRIKNENITPLQKGKKKRQNAFWDFAKIIIGIIALKYGGEFTVNNAQTIAEFIGMSEKLIGVTILAVGTSLPELITCISAAIKKKTDIAVGNIIGANILNILLIVGVSSIIKPLKYNMTYNVDLGLIIISTIMLEMFAFIPPIKKMSRDNGFIYVMIYITYVFNLVMLKV